MKVLNDLDIKMRQNLSWIQKRKPINKFFLMFMAQTFPNIKLHWKLLNVITLGQRRN
jgi:hypothetical protein